MAVGLRVTSAADTDMTEAQDWYENQSPGLGKAFVRWMPPSLSLSVIPRSLLQLIVTSAAP